MCMCAESATVSGGQSKKTALNLCSVYHAFCSSLKYKNAIGYPFKVNPPSLIDEGGTLPPYHEMGEMGHRIDRRGIRPLLWDIS